MSDTRADVVGPGPAPSPCKTDLPKGLLSVMIAFKTPSTLLRRESFLIKHGCTL